MARHRLLIAQLVLLAGCTDALLQPNAVEESTLDDKLMLRGQVCTGGPDPANFPVKVDFLIDKSGSMCVSDGPGAQQNNDFCQRMRDDLAEIGITEPGRVRALKELMARFRRQPNVWVALDPFESKIDSELPDGEDETYFVRAGDVGDDQIELLQANLGKGTDYQGALAQAYWRVESDILKTNPLLRPRTRYVVVLLTDGAPYPRCAADDSMPEASYAHADTPWGIWQDNPEDFCNAGNAGDTIEGFLGGAERNQNYQIFDAVDRLMALKEKHNIGDIRVHTILLFNEEAAALCGEQCEQLYNGLQPAEARSVAIWTLTQIAEAHGGGTFQEFITAADIELGALDYTSLSSRFAVKTLVAENLNAAPGRDGPLLDSDGDRFPDDQDSKAIAGTERFAADSDGDGFSDALEAARAADGFDPLVPDPRGCRDQGDTPARYSCADTDGDGLSQAAEAYLGTDETLFDTDADGISDGIEAAYGLDPLAPNDRVQDHDLDGVPDLLEVAQHTHPMLDDRATHARDGYRYELKANPQEDGRVCYDFLVSNIQLLTPQRASGQVGYNVITLTFGEAPESNVTRDYGVWRKACVFAQFAPPSVRVPPGPEIVLEPADFHRPAEIVPGNFASVCKGVAP